MSNWKAAVLVASSNGTTAITDPAIAADALLIAALFEAATLFEPRTDSFAAGKADTCRDIGRKAKEGGFASAKQREFAVKLVEWAKPRAAVVKPVDAEAAQTQAALRAAATAYTAAGDTRRAGTCTDIADKLARFGSFASDKQRDFAQSLAAAAPVAAATPTAPVERVFFALDTLPVPALFAVMQKHATLHAGSLKVSRKNQDSMCWLVWNDSPVGKIEDGLAIVWKSKAGADRDAIVTLLAEFDADPLAAAMKYGRLSGRCCSCGRDLTDPDSIERGIGPICAERF